MTNVGFKRLTDTAVIPTKAFPTDSGFDICADETMIIEPGKTNVVTTGIAVILPAGYEATIRPRSGITSRSKLRVQLGTIDNSYRGEIGVICDNVKPPRHHDLMNLDGIGTDLRGDEIERKWRYAHGFIEIRRGERIAQLVVSPVATFAGVEITDLDDTTRGSNGFGSTGV